MCTECYIISISMHAHCIMLTASSGKRNVTAAWRPSVCRSVCPVLFLTLIQRAVHNQRNSCDAASVHFGQTIRRINILYIMNNETELNSDSTSVCLDSDSLTGWTRPDHCNVTVKSSRLLACVCLSVYDSRQ